QVGDRAVHVGGPHPGRHLHHDVVTPPDRGDGTPAACAALHPEALVAGGPRVTQGQRGRWHGLSRSSPSRGPSSDSGPGCWSHRDPVDPGDPVGPSGGSDTGGGDCWPAGAQPGGVDTPADAPLPQAPGWSTVAPVNRVGSYPPSGAPGCPDQPGPVMVVGPAAEVAGCAARWRRITMKTSSAAAASTSTTPTAISTGTSTALRSEEHTSELQS